MRRTLPLAATIAAETGAVVVLYRFVREPEFAVAIALGFATWLLGSTLLYLGARLARVPIAVAAAGRVTLPVLRRRVDRALAASIVTGALVVGGAPAMAGPAPSPDPRAEVTTTVEEPAPEPDAIPEPATDPVPALPTEPIIELRSGRVGDPAAQADASTTPVEALTDARTKEPAPDPSSPPPSRPAAPSVKPVEPDTPSPAVAATPAAPPTTTGGSYTVVAGDDLWRLAARHLATSTGRERTSLPDDEVRSYWVRVCDANRDRIRSGDVNLIYPGEVVDLPPT